MQVGMAAGREALSWLEQAVAEGHGGKVLLVGLDDDAPQVAWAAGLSDASDYPNFVTFARFGLQNLNDCNGYWLLLPAEFDDCLGYRIQVSSCGKTWCGEGRWLDGGEWLLRETEPGMLLQDLLASPATLPGIMRRELTRLAERCEIAPPDILSGAGE